MNLHKLDPSTQALYTEFLDQLRLQDAHRSIGDVPGSFVTKNVSGRVYYYFQFSKPGGLTRQLYLGEKTETLQQLIKKFDHERPTKDKEKADLARLCSQLRAGGALATPHAVARVVEALADSGIFHHGGALIGTHAFTVIGNILATSWPPQTLQTQDVDVAIPPVGIVLPQQMADIPDALTKLGMGFLPVPPLDHKKPSTSFKVRGHPLRLDILTPLRGHEIKIVFLPQFNTGACGLPYLDYLLEETVEGGIVGADGILVRVPFPARFAFHKLLVSQVRAGAHLIRSSKDILQAAQIFAVLTQERPGDIDLAWEAVRARGKKWVSLVQRGLQVLAHQFPEIHQDVKASMTHTRL
jgi:hypothetical protein